MDARTLLTRLGAAFRTVRRNRGSTQAAVAELAGLPRLKIIQIERGDDSVSIGAYAAVAAALGFEFSLSPARRPTLEEVRGLLDDDRL